MTGGQGTLTLDEARDGVAARSPSRRAERPHGTLVVVRATAAELEAHALRLAAIDEASGGRTVWRGLEQGA
jgi:DNA polymerase-3 subunit epsilon